MEMQNILELIFLKVEWFTKMMRCSNTRLEESFDISEILLLLCYKLL